MTWTPQRETAHHLYGTVQAVNGASATLDFGDGGDPIANVPVYGGAPQVGDTVLVLRQGSGMVALASGPRIATGSVTTGAISAPTERTATFPVGRFASPPRVFTQTYEDQNGYAMVQSVTATSAVLTIRSVDGASSSVIGRIHWLAIGD